MTLPNVHLAHLMGAASHFVCAFVAAGQTHRIARTPGADAREWQEESEVMVKVRVVANDRLSFAFEALGFKSLTVRGKDELRLL